MKALKWIGIALVALIAIGAMFGGKSDKAGKTASADSQTSSAPAAEAPKEAAVKVTALKLAQDYDDNEAAADDVYKGKLLEVSGRVASIDKDAFDNTVVWLHGKNDFNRVMAKMSKENAAQAKTLKKGQSVTVSCMGSTRIIGSPTMDDCAVL
ncbi:hypothetical protein JFK97_02020 [Chromobacterium phragmitis]|uniref:OB-fold putative lipoprotein n=1 Tax=Chromobacterium amazonense TaxID=1382803 RepID=UPI0021B818B2|nr:OB-fold putative lipoprotein [Chromobacterium amazonense]MBM2883156.1 hypothetical protein [Chromobacterium amazonense]MDE1715688.1 OB-fold putative lipoprotein [Chromobacterium amazonense]